MRHRKTPRFDKAFSKLHPDIQKAAYEKFKLFQRDRFHPSLAIEKITGWPGIWSGRITHHYRWTFHFTQDPDTGEVICWHRTIGPHDAVYSNP
jgi:mRNA-degrading endonuclease RelE of RelBE toxin-antitoxin system